MKLDFLNVISSIYLNVYCYCCYLFHYCYHEIANAECDCYYDADYDVDDREMMMKQRRKHLIRHFFWLASMQQAPVNPAFSEADLTYHQSVHRL